MTGHLKDARGFATSPRAGWRVVLVEVARRPVEGETQPGVVPVVVMVPPRLVASKLAKLGSGSALTVTGMLDVDTDRSTHPARTYHSVIAHEIERVADDFEGTRYGRDFGG